MKANELMIGDWVQVPPELNQYKRIKNTFDMDEAVLYKPIPLTTDILEKSGFVKYIAWQYVLPKMVGETLVSIMPMKGLPNADNEWLAAIKKGYTDVRILITYIHELQHALKLCGINKEITL